MASSPSQALVKRSADTDLMPPPPPPKRIKRPAEVLDEDEYTDALSHIIARDFFPGLLETQTQQEYLDALESKDKEWIANAGRRLSEVMTPGPKGRRGVSMTPRLDRSTPKPEDTPKGYGGDTPTSVASVESSATPASKRGDGIDLANMSLGAFQNKYTSEDNESFNKLLDKQNIKRREKYAWMWSANKIPTLRQIAHRQRQAKLIAAQGGPEASKNKQLITTDSDVRPAAPNAWKSKPENGLMFIPSSIEDTHETVQQKAESTSRAGPKQVMYNNTRIQPERNAGTGHQTVPSSPSISAIKDAIAGRPRPTDSESGFTGGETPRVNGYAFVDEDEPEPEPSAEDQSYDINLLSSHIGSSSSPNPFTIQETRKREALHHRMVERVAKNKRAEKSGRDIKTPVPKFPSSPMIAFGRTPGARAGGATPGASKTPLTPAAQRLWAKVGSTPKRAESSSNLRNMWTPTPRKGK